MSARAEVRRGERVNRNAARLPEEDAEGDFESKTAFRRKGAEVILKKGSESVRRSSSGGESREGSLEAFLLVGGGPSQEPVALKAQTHLDSSVQPTKSFPEQ